ncbi:MAG: methyltransferase domain-containing protein [Chlorobia bacterium]|nr:methyltransferase domain-containing protein [Fimbriimonadaceae bacterium]
MSSSNESALSVVKSSKYWEVQVAQTEYRARLVESWQIPPGARVFEIGCGQGDMTVLLAEVVGRDGHVTAADIASPTYGSPLTLGQATDLLKASHLGNRIDFCFNFEVLSPASPFEDDAFDCVVFAHSSWYFESVEQLQETLRKVQPWARQLCFAEWDLQPRSLDQVPHLLAVLIQGQVEAFKSASIANVRTPLTRDKVEDFLAKAGWKVESSNTLDVEALQDADWEIKACLDSSLADAEELDLPVRFLAMLEGQVEILRQIALPSGNHPLDTYSIVATRSA